MELLDYLQGLFSYNHWANGESLRSLQDMDDPPERARRVMAHIVAAEWLWLGRLKQEKPNVPVWPLWGLPDVERQLPEIRQGWQEYLAKCRLQEAVSYTNSKGEQYTNHVRDVLMHVAMHGTYHRGQIAAAVRDRAGEPAYTDFIEAVRKNKL
ncbi:MAG: DinB family protein [Terriglobales bacterium]